MLCGDGLPVSRRAAVAGVRGRGADRHAPESQKHLRPLHSSPQSIAPHLTRRHKGARDGAIRVARDRLGTGVGPSAGGRPPRAAPVRPHFAPPLLTCAFVDACGRRDVCE
ncbi:hypothetical protein Arub01_13920 [Actinomadura rubrobrunea]|uniref:Uncharacterized protein n=1 Tax=Actinomadura rubrobrunea TaxID=115335 RepID=A0A9W6PUA2_9ACTN|nr:hypothetical protein Arub01_13920 [Actinomadura rubrobrunea]